MGDCQEQVKKYLKAFKHHPLAAQTDRWLGFSLWAPLEGGRQKGSYKQTSDTVWPDSDFKESEVEGSAQRGLITCHWLAQNPDLFVGASMGPSGWGGRTVRTCL
ncbi:hypothetical protein XENORESO_006667 [Xenotaenia resolanae]|uniref:Uncharacterized protein n=1 Tax=Xenotaenia resolanae TaxID=208358 RepID=A0ABV0VQV3_9TELE